MLVLRKSREFTESNSNRQSQNLNNSKHLYHISKLINMNSSAGTANPVQFK